MASSAFWQTFTNPQTTLSGDSLSARIARYEYMKAWYDGVVFLPTEPYKAYLAKYYRLYRHTRLLWNPVPNIINFWAGIIYPGVLSSDGLPINDNTPTAIPLPKDVDEALAAAIAQIWVWSNWQVNKSVWPRYGGMTGNALLEIKDMQDTRKVYLHPTKPEHVAEVTLNSAGDVLQYALEYRTRDSDSPNAQEYTYRKEVDRAQIRTYRGDGGAVKPWSYNGVPAVVDHPYGFCPAVWVSHRGMGGVFGEGAILSPLGTLGALAEINSLQSHTDDQVHKAVDTTWIFATDGSVEPLFNKGKRGATDEFGENTDADRESVRAFKVKPNTQVSELSGALSVAEARLWLQDQKEDFKMHYPEYTMYPQLRAMSQVTGPAAEILLGDISNPVREVRANYDRQLVKACQMAISVAAIRAHGDWQLHGEMDDARQKFMEFDEDSYADGDLDFEIGDRPLVPDPPPTESDKIDIADRKINKLSIPKEYVWENDLAIPADVIQGWVREAEQRRQEMQQAMQASGAQPGQVPQPNQQAQAGQDNEQQSPVER